MALGDGTLIPEAPTLYAVYRGFYVLPTETPLPANILAIDFFVARSLDDLTWENWQYLGRGDGENGFYFVHSGLDESTYYAYYIQYIYSDGSKGPVGALSSQQAELNASSSLNIDQLASKAYTTGLVTSGIFQGVIFRTDPNAPKVQMDPSGIWATDPLGNIVFYVHDDGSPAFFKGLVEAEGVVLPLNTSNTYPPSFGSEIIWTSDGTDNGNIIGGIDTYASSSSSSSNSGSLATPDVAIGSITWTNPGNALAQDTVVTTSILTSTGNNTTNYLKLENFGFNIPSNATINGVTANVVRSATTTGALVTDAATRLVLHGSVAGTGDHSSNTVWPSSLTRATYGSASDLWSQTLTPAEVNNSGFGFAIGAKVTSVDTQAGAYAGAGSTSNPSASNRTGSQPFANPGNVTGAWDGVNYSQVSWVSTGGESYGLYCSSYGFAIPTDATIKGITLRILADFHTSNNAVGAYLEYALLKGGTLQWPTSAGNYTPIALDTWVYYTFGGPSNMWGNTWTPADINNSGFGACVSIIPLGQLPNYGYIGEVAIFVNYTLTTATANIDYVSCGVSYTVPGFGGGVSNNQLEGYTYQVGSSDSAVSVIGSRDVGGITKASIQTQYNPNLATPSSVVATAGNNSVTIVDSAGLASRWIAPTLLNSWVNQSGTIATGYFKDPFGFVHLRGRIKSGAASSVAFVLPVGYRPAGSGTSDDYAAAGYDGASGSVPAFVNIASNGNVTIWFTTAPGDVGLGGITFLAEN